MTAAEVDATAIEMTPADEARRNVLENVVAEGIGTFVAVGNALAEIATSKLFRATHNTFESYVKDRWQLSRSRAYQLVDAARVSTIVDDAGLPPLKNEAQARELAGLEDDDVVQVFSAATTGTPTPTAAVVREYREQRLPMARTRQRRPLPDAFRTQLYRTTSAAESLVRVTEDDRWDQHLAGLADGGYLGDLKRTIDELQAVYDALESGVVGPNMRVTIVVTPNTATITAPLFMHNGVRQALKSTGTKWQTDRRTKTIKLPGRDADKAIEQLRFWLGGRLTIEDQR